MDGPYDPLQTHVPLGASDQHAPLPNDDGEESEDFAVEVSSLVPMPVRLWDRLRSSAIWGRLTFSTWTSPYLAAAFRVRNHLAISSWIAACAAAAVRLWRHLTAGSWVLAYYALAVHVWVLRAIISLRAWGRRALSSWIAARASTRVRAWDYRLSPRGKLRRGAVITVSLLVACAVIFGPGIASSIAASRSAGAPTHHDGPDVANAAAATQLGPWQSISIPIATNQPVAYTPAPADPSTIYACGAGSALHDSGFVPGNLQVWRTHDAGTTWQALPVPRFLANQCDLRIAATAPNRLTLLATVKGCQSYAAYISDDSGDQWTSVILPYGTVAESESDIRQCDLIATASHLYFWYSYGLNSSASNDGSVLLRSDDDGRSWTTASPGVALAAYCNVGISTPSRSSDDVLLASCPPGAAGAYDSGGSSVLRQSTDDGSHWRTLDDIPATGASILFTPGSSTALGQLGSSPLYAAYTLSGNDSLSGLRLIQTLDGQQWQPLPPLPVPGASPGLLGIRSVLGTTADGRLFVLGVDPGVGVSPASSTAASAVPADRWVWIWDPSVSRWSVLPSALPELPSFTCPDICWLAQVSWGAAAGGTQLGPYIWADTLPYNGNVLLRVFLPALQSARTTRSAGALSTR